jgi:hypothetical protein
MEKCSSCGAPCEVEDTPPYVEKWVDDDGNDRTTSRLGSRKYIFVPVKRKATVDEYIAYQELKDLLKDTDVDCKTNLRRYGDSSVPLRVLRHKKTTLEKAIKLFEEFLDFTK